VAGDGRAQRQPPARISGVSCRSNGAITSVGKPTLSWAAVLSALSSPGPCTICSVTIRFTARAASVPPISASVSKAAVCSGTGCFKPEASESPAERLQGNYSAHQPPPPGFRRKTVAFAERGVRDRFDERSILKLRRDETLPSGYWRGGLFRAVATTGKEIELRAGRQIGPVSALSEAVPTRPRPSAALYSAPNPGLATRSSGMSCLLSGGSADQKAARGSLFGCPRSGRI
jgi:hypothetical protein